MNKYSWFFTESPPVGVDYESPRSVQAYERNQRTSALADKNILERLGVSEGCNFLDLGCGTGALIEQALMLGANCHGVDVSEQMIISARNKLSNFGEKAKLSHCGILDFSAKQASFDVIAMRAVLHQFPDFWKQVVLDKVARFLRPGGLFYLWDIIYSFNSLEFESEFEGWIEVAGNLETEGYTRQDYETHIREEFSTFSWIVEGMLERSGFTISEIRYPMKVHAEYIVSKPSQGGSK